MAALTVGPADQDRESAERRTVDQLTEDYYQALLERGESEDSAQAQAADAAAMWCRMLRRTQ